VLDISDNQTLVEHIVRLNMHRLATNGALR
jgi:hypothetical protein